jgi:hypothetical protein
LRRSTRLNPSNVNPETAKLPPSGPKQESADAQPVPQNLNHASNAVKLAHRREKRRARKEKKAHQNLDLPHQKSGKTKKRRKNGNRESKQ